MDNQPAPMFLREPLFSGVPSGNGAGFCAAAVFMINPDQPAPMFLREPLFSGVPSGNGAGFLYYEKNKIFWKKLSAENGQSDSLMLKYFRMASCWCNRDAGYVIMTGAAVRDSRGATRKQGGNINGKKNENHGW